MTAKVIPQGKQQYFASGTSIPLSGGKLWTYAAGTSTPKQTWSDSAQVTPNANPIILDSRGEATIYWNGNYKVVLMDSADTLIWTVDNVSSELMIGEVSTAMIADEAVTSAKILSLVASKVTYTPAGTGSVATDVQTKLRETVSVKDFGAVGDGVMNDTAAIQAAIDSAASVATASGIYAQVVIPPSSAKYIITQIENKTRVILRGTGGVLKFKDATAADSGANYYPVTTASGATNVGFVDLIVEGNSANQTAYNVCDAITCTGEGSFVVGCKVVDAVDSGIMFSNAPHGQCLNNHINGTNDAGIYVNCDEGTDNLDGALISGNVIQNAFYVGIGVKRGAKSVTIAGNTIDTCGAGITTSDFGVGAGGNPEDITVVGNTLINIGYPFASRNGVTHPFGDATVPGEVGIALQQCRNSLVSGNNVRDCSGVLLNIEGSQDSVITGNKLRGYPEDPKTTSFGNCGVVFSNETKATGSHTGSGNSATLTDSTKSFIVDDLVGLTVNNTTDGSSGTITANTATTVTAMLSGGTDNDWDLSDAYTIVTTPQNIVFVGNEVSHLQDEGIYVQAAKDCVISGNIVKDVDNAGASNQALRLDSGVTRNIIIGNMLEGRTIDVTYNAGATDNIFRDNRLPLGTGTAKNGFQRNTSSLASPNSNVTPRYAGEVIHLANGAGIGFWQSTDTTNTSWIQLG